MRRRPRMVGLLWHWHRRLGVAAAFFVLVLVASGIALNHSSTFGLDRSFVDWDWLMQAYGDDSANLPAYQLGENWLSRSANGRVYFDQKEVAPCRGGLVGAVVSRKMIYAACAEELLLIADRGLLVESVTASMGLPGSLQAIGLLEGSVVLQSDGIWWLTDAERMDFSERATARGAVVHQLIPDKLPRVIREQIPAVQQWLSWERLLLDIHSGRVLGRFGVLLVDSVGIVLGTLATSGTAMWWLHRRRKQRHSSGDS
jgi:uncharacterized iron-regulated membrane protein